MREQVEALVRRAAERVVSDVDPAQVGRVESVSVTPARNPEHGDFATNAAMVLGKPLGVAPRDLAQRLIDALDDPDGVLERCEIAGPGFVNFHLAKDRWATLLLRILSAGRDYGRGDLGQGRSAMVEFVSANPTGPLTLGHGRNAVLGDAVASLLEATGWKVTREYYFNDAGRQMRVLADSLRARYLQALGREAELPEEGYQGQYLVDIARALADEVGDAWSDAPEDDFKQRAMAAIFADIDGTLERLGIRFDVHFNEHTLYDEGRVETTLADLRELGLVYEKDGAVFLRSTDWGLDRDRVLVKSSGEPTYLLPDIAYHRVKFEREHVRIVDVFGPDHIEQFPYVKGACQALGLPADRIELVLYQWVNLRRDGELVKMSTRKANFVTIDEILDDVGSDAFRYFMLERRADTHLDFDVELARERSDRNPVYKIQYAHARLCSIERKAGEAGLDADATPDPATLALLESPVEAELLKQLERWPDTVAHAAANREPQELCRYLLELASSFNAYVSDGKRHRVLAPEAPELSSARLALVRAVRQVLANGLGVLGIDAPESM